MQRLGGFSPGELIQGADGRLYGPTEQVAPMAVAPSSGSTWQGPSRRFMNSAGAAAGRPNGVIQARNGQFYGTTSSTRAGATGTVFAMDAAGARTTLHNFERLLVSGIPDGRPMSNLFEGADGSLYGTTFNAIEPFSSPGQVFKIGPAGDYTTGIRAYRMRAGVIQARDGRLYLTSSGGEALHSGYSRGIILRVEAMARRHSSPPIRRTESSNPLAELVEIDDGSLYGTSQGSGPPDALRPDGTIFRVDPATGTFTTRYSFSGPDGSDPVAG